jgi:predicted dehydrogenase
VRLPTLQEVVIEMKLALCIVGCGGYARKVLDYTRDVADDFRFYFASRDPDKARRYSETYDGAGHFGSYEEAAASPDVDAMYFLTPHHLHRNNALLAAANSKHVLMEKPIGRTMEEAREMARAAGDAGVKLMVAENYRFLPAVSRARELMASGAVGDLRTINVVGDWAGVPGGWRNSAEMSGGGSFIDAGIHLVDVLVNLGGMPESLYAATPPRVLGKEGEDGMAVVAHLHGGAVGVISFSNGTRRSRARVEVVVAGTRETLTFDPYGDTIERESLQGRSAERLQGGRGSSAMLREFRASILEDREPAMSAEEGMKDLAVVLAAYRSVERGEPVSLS